MDGDRYRGEVGEMASRLALDNVETMVKKMASREEVREMEVKMM